MSDTNNQIRKQIDAYLNGQLSEKEIELIARKEQNVLKLRLVNKSNGLHFQIRQQGFTTTLACEQSSDKHHVTKLSQLINTIHKVIHKLLADLCVR